MGEYVPSGWLAPSGASGIGRLRCIINRVQERTAYGDGTHGKHDMCEHVLPDKLTTSAACGTGRFCLLPFGYRSACRN